MDIKITNKQIDVLTEIGMIGAGNASTSLSNMLSKRVKIEVPSARMLELEKIPEFLGGAEVKVAAIYIQVTAPFMATFMVIFNMKGAIRAAHKLLGQSLSKEGLDSSAKSALCEVGNIVAGSYMISLSKIIGAKINYSIPGLAVDMLQAVLDGVLIDLATEAKNALVVDANFIVEDDQIDSHYLFLPGPKGLMNILKAIETKKES